MRYSGEKITIKYVINDIKCELVADIDTYKGVGIDRAPRILSFVT